MNLEKIGVCHSFYRETRESVFPILHYRIAVFLALTSRAVLKTFEPIFSYNNATMLLTHWSTVRFIGASIFICMRMCILNRDIGGKWRRYQLEIFLYDTRCYSCFFLAPQIAYRRLEWCFVWWSSAHRITKKPKLFEIFVKQNAAMVCCHSYDNCPYLERVDLVSRKRVYCVVGPVSLRRLSLH